MFQVKVVPFAGVIVGLPWDILSRKISTDDTSTLCVTFPEMLTFAIPRFAPLRGSVILIVGTVVSTTTCPITNKSPGISRIAQIVAAIPIWKSLFLFIAVPSEFQMYKVKELCQENGTWEKFKREQMFRTRIKLTEDSSYEHMLRGKTVWRPGREFPIINDLLNPGRSRDRATY